MATNDVIEHHGVKGQRWGVRRRKVSSGYESSGSRREERKRQKSATIQSQEKWNKTYANRRSMTDKELQQALNRINMENQLARQVSQIPKTRKQQFSKWLGKVSGQVATNLITSTVQSELQKAMVSGIASSKK